MNGNNGWGYGYNPYGYTSAYGNVPQDAYGQQMGGRQHATTKKDILNYIRMYANPSEVEQVEEFDTPKTRHICRGFKEIVLIDKQVISVPTTSGYVNVEVFFCPRCRKLIINSQTLEIL